MKKTLTVLARLRREETQQRRRKLAVAQGNTSVSKKMSQRAYEEMVAEENLAATDFTIANPFYLPHAQARVNELNARLRHLQKEEELARANVLESYRSQKLNEKLLDKLRKQELTDLEKREQKEANLLSEARAHNKGVRGN